MRPKVYIETEREEYGQWIAEVPELPGIMAYGQSQKEAISRVAVLALRMPLIPLHNKTPFALVFE